jgi:hypothetical protein
VTQLSRHLKVIRGVLFATGGGTSEEPGRNKPLFMARPPKGGSGERQLSHTNTPIGAKRERGVVASSTLGQHEGKCVPKNEPLTKLPRVDVTKDARIRGARGASGAQETGKQHYKSITDV